MSSHSHVRSVRFSTALGGHVPQSAVLLAHVSPKNARPENALLLPSRPPLRASAYAVTWL
jgi:hypothetical protein